MRKEIQQVSVKALFKRNGKVLLVKDPKGKWELPGGRIDFGEDPQETLQREIQEELGWEKFSIEEPLDAWSFTASTNDADYQFIVLIFSCSSEEEAVVAQRGHAHEYTDVQWLAPAEISNLTIRQSYIDSINKAFKK